MNLGVLENHPIVPVLVIDDADCAMALAEALCAGGIRCAEVTLRTSAALDAVHSDAPDHRLLRRRGDSSHDG